MNEAGYLQTLRHVQTYGDLDCSTVAELERELREYEALHDAGRIGTWMPTWGGRFWLEDPRPEEIDLETIALSLSRMRRFHGQTLGHGYSVAQHSVHVSRLVPPQFAMHGLMHDAPEAYCGDCITPLKRLLGDHYDKIEAGILEAVAQRFNFSLSEESTAAVKFVDVRMLLTEVRDLTRAGVINRKINGREGKPYLNVVEPWESDQVSYDRFLSRFAEIEKATARA